MTYEDAVAYLDSLTNYERTRHPLAMRQMRLERMHWLCERLASAHQAAFRSILVAGTNGKGSICAMIYDILRAAKLKVGLYTSPHLEDVRERIRLTPATSDQQSLPALWATGQVGTIREGSDWISRETFAAAIGEIRSVLEDPKRGFPNDPVTYFEVLTAAALLHFARERVEVAVIEVGLGGRLDATNVVEQAVSVFGPIALDHTDVLGKDLVSIAGEKAGIMKTRGRGIVICAAQQPQVSELLREAALKQECRFLEYGRHFSANVVATTSDGMRLCVRGLRGRYDDVTLPLLGRHQAENAASAVAAVEALAQAGVPHSAVRLGLANTFWPGRLEVVRESPLVVLDGAHNPHAAQALRMALEELWPGRARHFLVGMSTDKSLRLIAAILGPLASSITCTASRHPRACDPGYLAQQFRPFFRDKVSVIPDAVDAYTYLLNSADPGDLIVITGSLFLVGELRYAIRQMRVESLAGQARTKGTKSEVSPCRL